MARSALTEEHMIFRVHAETVSGDRVTKDTQAGSSQEATSVCGKRWQEEGVRITKVLKTKVVKGT